MRKSKEFRGVRRSPVEVELGVAMMLKALGTQLAVNFCGKIRSLRVASSLVLYKVLDGRAISDLRMAA